MLWSDHTHTQQQQQQQQQQQPWHNILVLKQNHLFVINSACYGAKALHRRLTLVFTHSSPLKDKLFSLPLEIRESFMTWMIRLNSFCKDMWVIINHYLPIVNHQLPINSHTNLSYVQSNQISCACVSGDRQWVVTAEEGSDGIIVIWDTHSAAPVKTFRQLGKHWVVSVDFSTDSNLISILTEGWSWWYCWYWYLLLDHHDEINPEPWILQLTFVNRHSSILLAAEDEPQQLLVWDWKDSENPRISQPLPITLGVQVS